MATKLGIYNAACLELGQRTLSSLTEEIPVRYSLDAVWDDVVNDCLEGGQWNFAIRTVKLVADTGITTNFGYDKVFSKPTDWTRTAGLSTDEYNESPLRDEEYKDENGRFYTDTTPLYLRYVSDDGSYGTDLTKWTAKFSRFVVLELAFRICTAVTQSETLRRDLFELTRRAKHDALNKDALNEGTRHWQMGRIVGARGGRDPGDRGSNSRLIG